MRCKLQPTGYVIDVIVVVLVIFLIYQLTKSKLSKNYKILASIGIVILGIILIYLSQGFFFLCIN